MIQRIQTVYLVLIVICLGLTFAFPFASYPTNDSIIELNAFGVSENTLKVSTWFPYYVTLGLSMGLGIMTIAQFKNRKRQLQIGNINYLIIILSLVFISIDSDGTATKLGLLPTAISYGIGMFLPVAALVFQFLANRGIKADEKLIKSMDRLR
jgi:hypothetical protein